MTKLETLTAALDGAKAAQSNLQAIDPPEGAEAADMVTAQRLADDLVLAVERLARIEAEREASEAAADAGATGTAQDITASVEPSEG